jgi:hypothetical protein
VWQRSVAGNVFADVRELPGGAACVVASTAGTLTCLAASSGDALWQLQLDVGPITTAPALLLGASRLASGGLLVFGRGGGARVLACYGPRGGVPKLQLAAAMPCEVMSAPAVLWAGQGACAWDVYVGCRDDAVHALRAEGDLGGGEDRTLRH